MNRLAFGCGYHEIICPTQRELLIFLCLLKKIWLVVSIHLKNISRNGNLPQVGVKMEQDLSCHHLEIHSTLGM